MKFFKLLLMTILALFALTAAASAADFSWTRDFNIQAKADPTGFRIKMATRFDLSDFQAMALRNIFASPADAYIMLRFGEIKGVLKKLTKDEGKAAIRTYRDFKSKGWNVLARILGVDTESREYLALKEGQDLYAANDPTRGVYEKYARAAVN